MLAFVRNEPIHTPESRARLLEALRRHRALGRSGTALLYADMLGASLIKKIQADIYREVGEPFLFADDEAGARAWLQQRLRDAQAGGGHHAA